MKTIRMILWVLVAAASATIGIFYFQQHGSVSTANRAPGKRLDAPFRLLTSEGHEVTRADFSDKPAAWFFGFTHCPDVCPTALFEMSEHLSKLGPAAEKLRVIFITVDPERDTPAILRDYLSAFDSRIVGLTGDLAQIEQLAKAFHVYFKKHPTADGGYTMDHSAIVILTGKDGGLQGTLDFHEPSQTQQAKLHRLVGSL